jgi:hypothetical protein
VLAAPQPEDLPAVLALFDTALVNRMVLRVGVSARSTVTIEVLTVRRTDFCPDPGLWDDVVGRPGGRLSEVDEDSQAMTPIVGD